MSRHPRGVARVEGDEIVIRVPIKTLTVAFGDAWEQTYGDADIPVVTDVKEFAGAVVDQINMEDEDGSTAITKMLDREMVQAVEFGCEGVSDSDGGEE